MKYMTRRPSAAMVIAMIALIMSLAGTSFAAVTLSKNSVRSKHIKNGQVKTADLRRSSVTSAKLAAGAVKATDVTSNSLGGSQIDESTLGEVPTAAAATTATTASALSTLTTYSKRLAATDLRATTATYAAALAAAPSTDLVTVGPFTLYAKCFIEDEAGDLLQAVTFIRTTENSSIFDSDSDELSGDAYLDIASLEDDRVVDSGSISTGDADMQAEGDSEWGAAAPSGARVHGQEAFAFRFGTVPGGDALYGAGDACTFWGYANEI